MRELPQRTSVDSQYLYCPCMDFAKILNQAISDNQMNIVRSVWETLVTFVLGLKLAATTMKFNTNLSSNHAQQLLPAMRASLGQVDFIFETKKCQGYYIVA